MLQLIKEIFNEDSNDPIDARFTNGEEIFAERYYTEPVSEDLLLCIEKTIEEDPSFTYQRFVEYIEKGRFSQVDDLIFNLPIFRAEAKNYRIKRESEDIKEEITESLYHCNKCKRPVASQTRQTRSSDEGVSVFIHCAHCNITKQIG